MSSGARFARDVRARYASARPRDRLHVRARLATAPIERIVEEVVALAIDGPIVEVGAGHGIVTGAIAAATDRTVVGVDIDAAKVAVATRSAEAAGLSHRMRYEIVNQDWRPGAGHAAVVLVDVLYLLEPDDQEALVRAAAAAIVSGGILVVKETDALPRWKAQWTRAQEAVAVRTITKRATGNTVPPTSADVQRWLREAGLKTSSERLDAWRPWPHYLTVGQRD